MPAGALQRLRSPAHRPPSEPAHPRQSQPGHPPKHTDILAGHEHAVVAGLLPSAATRGHRIDGQHEVWRDGVPSQGAVGYRWRTDASGRTGAESGNPGGAGNGNQGFHPRTLRANTPGRDVPVSQPQSMFQQDAVEREYVVPTAAPCAPALLSSSPAYGARPARRCVPVRDADADVAKDALAADVFGQHAKRRAIDAGDQLDRATALPGRPTTLPSQGVVRRSPTSRDAASSASERLNTGTGKPSGSRCRVTLLITKYTSGQERHRLPIGRWRVDAVFTNEQQVAVRWAWGAANSRCALGGSKVAARAVLEPPRC